MPRKQYPSDHRRYFRVMEDILDSPKLRDEVSADVFRFYIRLLAMLNRTKSRDGKINLGRRALNLCAGREQRRHSLAIARAGAVASLYTLSVDGEQTLIGVRKWAKHQDFAPSSLRPDSVEIPSPNLVPNPTPTTTTADAVGALPPQQDLSGWVRMLKGEIPTGLNGQTWDTPAAWLEAQGPIIAGEAQAATGEESGKKFNGKFKAIMMRYWGHKKPKQTGGKNGPSGQREGPLTAAHRRVQERIDRAQQPADQVPLALSAEARERR